MTPVKFDEEEEKAKRGLGEVVWYALKHPAFMVTLAGAAVWGWARPTAPKVEDVYWDSEEIRVIVREEVRRGVGPLESGFKAMAKRQSKDTQIAVFEAMEASRRSLDRSRQIENLP